MSNSIRLVNRRWSGRFSYLLVVIGSLLGLAPTCGPQPGPVVEPDALTLGAEVAVQTSTVGTEGGTVVVSDPGGPLDGMTIEVPTGAYAGTTTWSVSYRPIVEHRLSVDVQPLTPLISLAGVEGYAEEPIQVKVPVALPTDYFAMGFYCDPVSGELEAIPLADAGADSVTLATRHFSDVLIGGIAKSALTNLSKDTGFLPGQDDWHFPNWGSYVSPLGNCSGMCLTAMWYYVERRKEGEPQLWRRYDNDMGAGLGTPDFWLDDDMSIKLVSMAQENVKALVNNEVYDKVLAAGLKGAERNYYAVAYALKVTGEPQYIGVGSEGLPVGHALICYGMQGGMLCVADPNFPGDQSRRITFDGVKFQPYASGARKDSSQAYDRVLFYGKTSLVQWSRMGSMWTDFDSGGIGWGKFPEPNLWVVERDGSGSVVQEYGLDLLNPNYVTQSRFEVQMKDSADRLLRIYRFGDLSSFQTGVVELQPGSNWLGFYVAGNPDLMSGFFSGSGPEKLYLLWSSFDWVNVVYGEEQPVDPDLAAMKKCGISVRVYGHFREPPAYEWQGTAIQEYDDDVYQEWISEGSFSGNTFTGSWRRAASIAAGEPNDSEGSLSVQVDPATKRVLSFTASKTETTPEGWDPVYVTTASVKGGEVPFDYYAGPPIFTPQMMYLLNGEAVCQQLSTFQYRVERSESEWFTVVPWTEMTSYTCTGGQWTAEIAVLFSAE